MARRRHAPWQASPSEGERRCGYVYGSLGAAARVGGGAAVGGLQLAFGWRPSAMAISMSTACVLLSFGLHVNRLPRCCTVSLRVVVPREAPVTGRLDHEFEGQRSVDPNYGVGDFALQYSVALVRHAIAVGQPVVEDAFPSLVANFFETRRHFLLQGC